MAESPILRRILLACTALGWRVFRNNTGQAWTGNAVTRITRTVTVTLDPGCVVIKDARPIRFGLCEGSSDIIGWTPGGRFVAVEVKAPKGKLSEPQRRFLEAVRDAGGVGIEARSEEDVSDTTGACKSTDT